METSITKPYLTPHEAAAEFGVSVSTIHKWVRGGKLPALKTLGQHNRIPSTAIQSLIEEQNQNQMKGNNDNES